MDREKPSSTALAIATALSLLAAKQETAPLVTPEQRVLAEWVMKNSSTLNRWTFPSLKHSWMQSICYGLERALVPGMIEHYARRKQALEQLATQAIERGARQVVVLGAGFDMLAARLTLAHPEVNVIEVDHPSTQQWKAEGLQAGGFPSPALLPADLTDPDRLFLLRDGYLTADRPVFWVAEGLFMYFSEAAVRQMFANVRKLSPPGSSFAFTYMQPGEDGRVSFTRQSGLLNRWLARVREPFAWGIRREALPEFLAEMGVGHQVIEPSIVKEVERLNVGEYIALAELNVSNRAE